MKRLVSVLASAHSNRTITYPHRKAKNGYATKKSGDSLDATIQHLSRKSKGKKSEEAYACGLRILNAILLSRRGFPLTDFPL